MTIKPFASYDIQIQKYRDRNLIIENEKTAKSLLWNIGYYRLSAYTYPFRESIEIVDSDGKKLLKKLDQFLPNSSIELIHEIYLFDIKLRQHCLNGLEIIEIYLRAQISYKLGAVGPLAHMDPNCLDVNQVKKKLGNSNGPKTLFEKWENRLRTLSGRSNSEDFVVHHKEVLQQEMPIWVVSELFDFGATEMLYSLLKKPMQNEISEFFEIRTGRLFGEMVSSFTSIRNYCAHYSRFWNRKLPIIVGKFDASQVPPELMHLVNLVPDTSLYSHLAMLGSIVGRIEGNRNWCLQFVEICNSFPNSDYVSLENDMNFPENWRAQDLWKH